MYHQNQTLRHKETNKLVALHPVDEGSTWNWELGKETRFIDENGHIFNDDIKEYTHIQDWFGRPAFIRGKSENKYVDIELKQYIVDEKTREEKKKIATEEWIQRIFDRLDKSIEDETYRVSNPFADGSKCQYIKDEFFKRVEAQPLFYIHYKFGVDPKRTPSITVFRYKDYFWHCDTYDIVAMDFNTGLIAEIHKSTEL